MIWIVTVLLWAILTKQARRKQRLLIIGLSMLFFFGNGFIVNWVLRNYETNPLPRKEIPAQMRVGIVLGGFSYYDFRLKRIHFNRNCDRVFQAVLLYKMGYIKKLLISGGSGSMLKPYEVESILIKEYLVGIGIPAEDVLTEPTSKNTYENALFSKKTLNGLGYPTQTETFLLITSAFHMPRAVACFQKAGIRVLPYPSDRRSGENKLAPDDLLIPSASNFDNWNNLIHEWVGFAIYKLTGKA
jgi:uncharacterized SAM-binding protein YcdF (DUF218 family)